MPPPKSHSEALFWGVPDGNSKIATEALLKISLIAPAVQIEGGEGASDLGVSTSYISSPSVRSPPSATTFAFSRL